MLSVGWLVIAANIAYRVWADRLAGLSIGLWRQGWVARVLLVVVAAALAAPMVYAVTGWLRRRGRRLRERLRQRHGERDQPRRLAVLGSSSLRELPPDTLARLASVATWVHPRPGQQVVFAGTALPQVYTVVEGALEGRAPGDPSGSVRERVGAGGIVGLGSALTGTPPVLAWHAIGTTLLALPAYAVADGVRPGSRPTQSQGEIEALLAQAPALAVLSTEDRLGLARAARPVWLSPGAAVTLFGTDTAQLIVSGSVVLHSGDEVGRGALLGPGWHDEPVEVGHARSAVHLLILPAVSGLALLLGASASRLRAEAAGLLPGRAPTFGVHPPASYPPLAAPPGPPPPRDDAANRIDRRFEGRLRWLLVLVLLLGLGLTGANLLPAVAWAEMADDQVLLHVGQGHATAILAGSQVRLRSGDDLYLSEGDSVEVADRSGARLTYRGGAITQLCAGSAVTIGALSTSDRPLVPTGTLRIERGLVVTDTATRSTAFRPLVAVQESASGTAVSSGRTRFAMASTGPLLADGAVILNGTPVKPRGGSLGCGGEAVAAGSPASSEPSPADSAGASPSASASAVPSASTSAQASASPSRSTAATRTPGPAAPGTSAPPPDATVPQIAAGPSASPTGIYTTADGTTPSDGDPASSITSTISVTVQDAVDSPAALVVTIRYRLVPEGGSAGGWQTVTLARGATNYRIGPFRQDFTGEYRTYIDVEATVRDAAGNTSAPSTASQLITVRDYIHG
jgi:putative peptide zinc metalloprotease protein